jgi:hypothetical protein
MALFPSPDRQTITRRVIRRRHSAVHVKIIVASTVVLAILVQTAALLYNLTRSNHTTVPVLNERNTPVAPIRNTESKQEGQVNIIPGTKAVVAYAISITSCPTLKNTTGTGIYDKVAAVFDGPAILGHSIHRSSIRFNSTNSKYDYSLYAFIHPDATDCAANLAVLGYEVVIRSTPFDVSHIHNQHYKIEIEEQGCCGSKEFMKLWAYTLVDHPIVVFFDTDVFVNKPLDNLFDAMLAEDASKMTLPTMFNKPLPTKIDFFFTRDYKQQSTITKDPSKYGVQGGFFVARPDMSLLQELLDTIIVGNYTKHNGWGALFYGGYWGSAQIQGFLSYFYGHVRPSASVELNRCLYNSMTDDNPLYKGKCRTGQQSCEDCRLTPVSDVFSVHMTTCWKPWQCPKIKKPHPDTCNDVHLGWFQIRQSLEIEWGTQVPTDGWWFERTLGYCHRPEGTKTRQYIPLQFGPKAYSTMTK